MKFLQTIDCQPGDFGPGGGLGARLRAALARYKVVHVRGLPHGIDPERTYAQAARCLGEFLFKNENPLTAELDTDGWIDMRYDAALAPTHAYRHGNGRMPLHMDGVYTDVRFDLIFLWSAGAAKWGGATTFIDGDRVVAFLEEFDADLLRELRETPVLFAKGGKSKYHPIIFDEDGRPAFNWNLPRLSPANTPHAADLAHRFNAFCEQFLVDGGEVTDVRLATGEAVFFHNRLVLHGRRSFFGDRCLMKGAVALERQSGWDRDEYAAPSMAAVG